MTRKKTARKQNAKSLENLKKGHGRPPGVPNKVTIEAKRFCTGLVADPVYQANLRKRMQNGTVPPAVETMIWHYAAGKPKERVELGADESLANLIREAGGLPALPPPEDDEP